MLKGQMLTSSDSPPRNLQDFLDAHVTTLKASDGSEPLSLYVLADDYEFVPPDISSSAPAFSFLNYTPRHFRTEYLARRQLVLVYQGPLIVLGLVAYEYAHIPVTAECVGVRWSRSYIQYIDSTGLFAPRLNQSHLTKSLVRAYLLFCTRVLHVQMVHLLATAKPSFLFAGSEFVVEKRALSSVKLVNWWIAVLQDLVTQVKDARVFVYAPDGEGDGSARLKRRIKGLANWTYGLPYELRRRCVDHVPLFEDDPKWRHFEATILDDDEIVEQVERAGHKKPRIVDSDEEETPSRVAVPECNMTVKQFFESLQVRPEFRSELSVFFVIKFADRMLDVIDDSGTRTHKSDLARLGCKLLGSLTFETRQEARKSSQKVLGWIKLMGCKPTLIQEDERVVDCENADRSNVQDVRSVQSLIRRK